MDKWEVCIYSPRDVVVYSPKGSSTIMKDDDFIKKFVDAQHKILWGSPPSRHIIIQWLLDNNWEPYAHESGNAYFRRKIEMSATV